MFTSLLHLWVRVAAFGAASFALCYGQRGWPDTSAPKAVRGQKRLSTLAEALPLAREIGAGSRAPREIDAGSRGCRSLWRVRSMRDHTPSGIVPWKESARMRGRRSMAHFGRAFSQERTQSTLLGVYLRVKRALDS